MKNPDRTLLSFRSVSNPHGLRFIEGEGGAAPAPTEAPAQPAAEAEPKPTPPAREETDWKAEARKWESRAKENSEAAKRLAEIEDANKSEMQRASEARDAAEARAKAAESAVLRRDVALEHGLSKDDAALLEGVNSEEAMRALAARLAVKQGDAPAAPTGFHMDQTGRNPAAPPNEDEMARAFFGI